MHIGRIGIDSAEEYARLSAFAFQYELTDDGIKRLKELVEKEVAWGVFDHGKLVTGLRVLNFDTYLYGQKIKMGGIAAVASWPEYRRAGLAAQLLQHSVTEMKNSGHVLSYLFPFKQSFYRRYGWEVTSSVLSFSASLDRFPVSKESWGGIIRKWSGELDVLNTVFQRFARGYNGAIARTSERWLGSVLKNNQKHTYLYWEDGEPQGYLMYTLKDQEMAISEWVNATANSERAFLGFIAQHDSMAKTVKWDAPLDSLAFDLMLNEPNSVKVCPRHMARVVDIEGLFKQSSFSWENDTRALQVGVTIEDEFAPWNQGEWTFCATKSGISAQKGNRCGVPPLECSIQAFTCLVMGYHTPEHMRRLGWLDGSVEQLETLRELFPQRTNYSTDYF